MLGVQDSEGSTLLLPCGVAAVLVTIKSMLSDAYHNIAPNLDAFARGRATLASKHFKLMLLVRPKSLAPWQSGAEVSTNQTISFLLHLEGFLRS